MQWAFPHVDIVTRQTHRAITTILPCAAIHANDFQPGDLQAITADDRTVVPFDARQTHCPYGSVAEIAQDVLRLHVLRICPFAMHRSALPHQRHRSELSALGNELAFKVRPNDLGLSRRVG